MNRGHFRTADGCRLEFEIAGEGPPVLWQHGLGASFAQPAAVFPAHAGRKRITLACRGHEASDLGDPARISIATFADDAVALLDHLDITTVAAGGISLGAALSLRLVARYPERVNALIVARPAWVDQPANETQSLYVEVARLIQTFGLQEGLAKLQSLPAFAALQAQSPDNAKSLLSYFSRSRPETTIALLSSISAGHPGIALADLEAIKAPTLVIANGEDMVHPLDYAKRIAGTIPGAVLQVITSKTVSPAAHETEFRQALYRFLSRNGR